MTKKKTTSPTKRPFHQGRDLYEEAKLGYKVYIEAALWSARSHNIPLSEVKEYIKVMVADHIVQELGYEA